MSAELVRRAMQAALSTSEFNDRLQALYIARADEDRFRPPVEIHRSVKWAPQNFPCGEIQCDRGARQQVESKTRDILYSVTVFWHVDGNDEEQLEDEIGRLVETTHEFFRERPNFLPWMTNASVWTGDEDFSPLIQNLESNGYTKTGAVVVFVRVLV